MDCLVGYVEAIANSAQPVNQRLAVRHVALLMLSPFAVD